MFTSYPLSYCAYCQPSKDYSKPHNLRVKLCMLLYRSHQTFSFFCDDQWEIPKPLDKSYITSNQNWEGLSQCETDTTVRSVWEA